MEDPSLTHRQKAALRLFGSGNMHDRIVGFDWSSTPLGPIDSWPECLLVSLRIILASKAPAAVYWGPDFLFLYNDALVQMLGHKHPSALGSPAKEVFQEIWPRIGPMFGQIVSGAGGVNLREQYLPINRSGTVEDAWFDFSASPIITNEGTVGGILNIATEVTEQVQAQKRLEETTSSLASQEHFLETTLSNIGDYVYIWNRKKEFIYVNTRTLELWGISRKEVQGKKLEQLNYPPHICELLSSQIDEVIEKRTSVRGAIPYTSPTGASGFYEYVFNPLFDRSGEVEFVTGISHDVSKRIDADKALRKSEERYRTLFESIDEGFCVFEMIYDEQGHPVDYRWTETNPAFELHTGLVNAVGKTARELVPDLEPHWPETYGRVAKTGRNEHFVEHSAPMNRWFEVEAFRIGPAEDHTVGLLFRNVTERKRIEDELKRLNETLEQRVAERTVQVQEQANRLRALASQLAHAEQRERQRLAMILHDHIQQLLAVAHMQLEVLDAGNDFANDDRPTVADIQATIKEALAASRSLAVDLSPPVLHNSGIIGALSWLALRMKEKHQMEVRVSTSIDAEPASDDVRYLLFESARELLFNISKHAKVSTASVSLYRTAGDQLRLIVSDKGQGFSPQTLANQAPEDSSFGLFSIRERLAHLGGQMDLDSAPGEGTTITLTIPDAGSKGSSPATEQRSEIGSRRAAAFTARHKEDLCRILIADDHRIMREGLVHLLKFEPDIEVVGEAVDGAEALHMAKTLRPDIIIMDINLGSMSGVEATQKILQTIPDAQVIGLTMHHDPQVMQAMLDAGARTCLSKGGPSADLIAAIRQHCN